MKAFSRLEEPLSFKGGMLAELLKEALSDPATYPNYRGVRISTHISKCMHAWLRRKVMPRFSCQRQVVSARMSSTPSHRFVLSRQQIILRLLQVYRLVRSSMLH